MLTELIQASLKKNYTKELRELIDKTTEQMQLAGVPYQGTCIPLKEKRDDETNQVVGKLDYSKPMSFAAASLTNTQVWDLESAIYNTSVLKEAGAQFIFSLKNNVQVPLCDKLTAYWAAETGAPEGDADPQLSETSIAPHRLTTYITVSKMLLNQTQNVESLLTEMLASAINQKLEQSIFTATQQTNGVKALFPSSATSITSYADLCNFEDTTADILNPTYVLSKSAKNKLRQMQRGTSNSNVMEDGKIDGTTTITSSNVEDSYLVFGDFSKLKVCVWSDGIDVIVDAITDSVNGNVKLIVNFYVDYYFSDTKAYAVATV